MLSLSFLGNFYTEVKEGGKTRYYLGTFPSNNSVTLEEKLKTSNRYLYEYQKGSLEKVRKEVIPDSYAIDSALYLQEVCKKISSLSGSFALCLKKENTVWRLNLVSLSDDTHYNILSLNKKGWYSISDVNSTYDILWQEYSKILFNVELLEHMLVGSKDYKEIQAAVIGGVVVGFGVWL